MHGKVFMFLDFFKAWKIIHSFAEEDPPHQARKDYEYCKLNHIHWAHWEQKSYPPLLKHSHSSLKAFYYLGEACWEGKPLISVVGSRNSSTMGRRWLDEHFSSFVQSNPLTVVSGGALGIDQRAHGVALKVGCPTIAFLPSGLKSMYPKNFLPWAQAIAEGRGAVVSGFPLESPMYKSHFHRRNRWIAEISLLTFMVEGRSRSGSFLTAKKALDLGRSVVCLPQSPYSFAQAYMDVFLLGGEFIRDNLDLQIAFDKALARQPLFEKS